MLVKFILSGILATGVSFFGGAEFIAAQETEGKESAEVSAGAEADTGSGMVPAEIQQQLDSAQKTVETISTQVQSVKEKGLVQTVWDNITAPFAAVWQQIMQIFGQALSIF